MVGRQSSKGIHKARGRREVVKSVVNVGEAMGEAALPSLELGAMGLASWSFAGSGVSTEAHWMKLGQLAKMEEQVQEGIKTFLVWDSATPSR